MNPLNSAVLGPIRMGVAAAARAKMARDALHEIARTTTSPKTMQGAAQLALADDATLDRLTRMLKS